MGDPLSAMMNFISDVNPLASVFKSPDGASPAASSRVWYSETPRDLATDALLPRHRQASRALRRRPAGVRPRPPRAGEREFALRHPQPPQRGVDASHRQREGDTTARGGEGACAFQRFTFPSLTVGGFSNAARASAPRGVGAIRPQFAPKPREPEQVCVDPAPCGGAGAFARAIEGAGWCPPDLPSPSSPFSALRPLEATHGWFFWQKSHKRTSLTFAKMPPGTWAGAFFSDIPPDVPSRICRATRRREPPLTHHDPSCYPTRTRRSTESALAAGAVCT